MKFQIWPLVADSFPVPRPIKVKCPACERWMLRRSLVPAPTVTLELPPVPELEVERVPLRLVRAGEVIPQGSDRSQGDQSDEGCPF